VGELCLVALHALLAPVHGAFHVALFAGLAYAVWDRLRASRSARQALRQVSARRPIRGDPFWLAAREAGVDPSVIRVTDDLPNPAFTIGWLRPRVYIARCLAERLAPNELHAVLAHEGAHVARRDPLRLATVRFFACMLFWIPALRRLAADLADEAEVLADDAAARGAPLVLASAILCVAAAPVSGSRVTGAVGFTCHDILERRVRRLAGEAAPAGTHVTRRSVAGAAAMLLLVWVSGAIMAHPLPDEAEHSGAAHASHAASSTAHDDCRSHRELAIQHLKCRRLELADGRVLCPHELRELAAGMRLHG
jgi:beta-lactamase regulating signal transducer with metallopeptidase domain